MVQLALLAVAIFFTLFFYYAAILNRDHESSIHRAVPAH